MVGEGVEDVSEEVHFCATDGLGVEEVVGHDLDVGWEG